MFSSVTSWLGVGEKGDQDMPSEGEDKENQEVKKPESKETTKTTQSESQTPEREQADAPKGEDSASTKEMLEDVSAKAINTAKEWGSFLYSFGKAAGKTVADTAKQIKTSVEEKTLLGDFAKEQDKFVTEKKEKTKHQEAAVPPWVGYNEEETMKTQILALSSDKRNFLRNPPSGVQYQFDFTSVQPVAMVTLQEDPNLQKMRFDLVPKQVKEEIFWRNYFYRVSLIKQSTQLTSLAQTTGGTGESRSSSSSRRSSTGSESKGLSEDSETTKKEDSSVPQAIGKANASNQKEEDLPPESPPHDNEFVSDAFTENEISEEDLRKEMEQLGVSDDKKDIDKKEGEDLPQWEKELQQELQEYEMVNDGADLEDDDLEREILEQIEQEAQSIS